MSLTITQGANSGREFKLLPPGTYPAVCTWIVDLGMQELTYNGETSEKPRVRLRFEVPSERVTYLQNGEETEGPMTIWKEYTALLHEKATLRKHLESWRGKSFTPTELMGFDLTSVLGKPCLITVVHDEFNGREYAKVEGVSRLVKGMTVEAEGDLVKFDSTNHSQAEFEALPEWLQEKVRAGQDLLKRQRERAKRNEAATFETATTDGFADSDIPF